MSEIYTVSLVILFVFLVYVELRFANRNGKS